MAGILPREEIIEALKKAFPYHSHETPKGKLAIKVDGSNVAGVNAGSRNILLIRNVGAGNPFIEPARSAKRAEWMVVPHSKEKLDYAIECIRELIRTA